MVQSAYVDVIYGSKNSPPIGVLILSQYVQPDVRVDIKEKPGHALEIKRRAAGDAISIEYPVFSTTVAACRYLARLSKNFYGETILQKTEVDHWLTFCLTKLSCSNEVQQAVRYLDSVLSTVTYLVGHTITIADIEVWAHLYQNGILSSLKDLKVSPKHVQRWYEHLASLDSFKYVIEKYPVTETKEVSPSKDVNMGKKDGKNQNESRIAKEEAKFVDLPGAEMGEVVVRFPPEASGFLHVGHAKAVLLNQYYQLLFQGKLVMRFDDTNPEKEKEDFEKVIREDVEMLQVKPDVLTFTSDYFDLFLEMCETLIIQGKAYADDTDPETMKAEREQRKESKNRNNGVNKNLQMWEEMKKGTEYGTKCCVRAKMDMNSDNGCMRDATMYRCKKQHHPRTGNKYNVYPTYDFSCPIVDSIEGITHVLRTTEYHDRDPQYFWFIDALNLRKPYIYEYSRLNMMNTVLSKRKLTWFVENGIVDGWDDPRMPTVKGILRRGMTVEGLKQFIIAQGSSRSVVVMDWDKIWAFNRKVIDPIAPRYNAVEKEDSVPVYISDAVEAAQSIPKHPKNPDVGLKTVWMGQKVLIDAADAELFKVGDSVTFINWGNLLIKTINKETNGKLSSVNAELNLDNKDFKKTLKVTWLAETEKAPLIPCACIYYDHIISKPVLERDEDFKTCIAENTKIVINMLGDPEIGNLKKNDIIQIQRKGFFICDQPYDSSTVRHTGRESPAILISIPDGTKDTATFPRSVLTIKNQHSKEQQNQARGKSAEKSPQDNENKTMANQLSASELCTQIEAQGNKIRALKTEKAPKEVIDTEVKLLLGLKESFKIASGKDWKPGMVISNIAIKPDHASSIEKINQQIVAQGNKVRDLKNGKASKDVVEVEVKILLELKQNYKNLAGKEWKPSEIKKEGNPSPQSSSTTSGSAVKLDAEISEQGNKIRELKSAKVPKDVLDPEIQKLLKLKAEYKTTSGKDWKPPSEVSKPEKNAQSKQPLKTTGDGDKKKKAKSPTKKEQVETAQSGLKKVTRLGMEASKEDCLSEWYSQVITKGELIEYYDISGCYILRPWAYNIWESIKEFFDCKIKGIGVQNCYFPMFVSAQALEKEKTHVADFAPEVAWVTKSGNSDLAEPIAIRPTSETVMYPTYAKWIKSHRDLPLLLNQWCNVVRWEFKHPQPFLRTREFLWQEGHTAYASQEEAVKEVYVIVDFYADVYEKLLAIPVIKGRKTEKEKFAGGDFTTTCEAYVAASGRAIQGATSHHLGQNFSKMFDIVYEDPETSEKKYVYQNSWGLTTRTIGVMVMVHGDNNGLILPPRVACYQVIVVPCGINVNLSEKDKEKLIDSCKAFEETLSAANIRCKGDYRDNYSPGWKFNHWELKGVPVRIELGPRDIKQGDFVAVRRDTGDKTTMKMANAVQSINSLLEDIQDNLFKRANAELQQHLGIAYDWNEFCKLLDKNFLIQAPFCGEITCEDAIKKDSTREEPTEVGAPSMGAKSLCISFQQPAEIKESMKCIHPDCKKKPVCYTLFGRSY